MGLDPIILGHNQFIGVSHLSQEAARTRVERFSDMGRVGELLRFCVDSGVRGMMLSSHPRARDILDYLRAEGLAGDMSLYPLIPYAQGYVRRMNAVGLTGLLKEIVLSAPWRTRASIAAQSNSSAITTSRNRALPIAAAVVPQRMESCTLPRSA